MTCSVGGRANNRFVRAWGDAASLDGEDEGKRPYSTVRK
jgi:hypothetical protein